MTTGTGRPEAIQADPPIARPLAVKVPEITIYFWIIKVLSTAMGEALSDFLDGGSSVWPVFGVLLALIVFVVALRMQFRSARYVTAIYWFAVAMVATFGTMAADGWHQAFGIPYVVSSSGYLLVLAVIFWRWYAMRERCRSTASTPGVVSTSTGAPCSPRSRSAPRSVT